MQHLLHTGSGAVRATMCAPVGCVMSDLAEQHERMNIKAPNKQHPSVSVVDAQCTENKGLRCFCICVCCPTLHVCNARGCTAAWHTCFTAQWTSMQRIWERSGFSIISACRWRGPVYQAGHCNAAAQWSKCISCLHSLLYCLLLMVVV